MSKNKKLLYNIFFTMLGIFIAWWFTGSINPWKTQLPLYAWGMGIPFCITVGIGVYIFRNFENWSSLTRRRVGFVFLIIAIILVGLMFYVNWYMPKGEMLDMGYDDEGNIRWVEDVRGLNVPDWAKAIKYSEATTSLLIVAMSIICATLLGNKNK